MRLRRPSPRGRGRAAAAFQSPPGPAPRAIRDPAKALAPIPFGIRPTGATAGRTEGASGTAARAGGGHRELAASRRERGALQGHAFREGASRRNRMGRGRRARWSTAQAGAAPAGRPARRGCGRVAASPVDGTRRVRSARPKGSACSRRKSISRDYLCGSQPETTAGDALRPVTGVARTRDPESRGTRKSCALCRAVSGGVSDGTRRRDRVIALRHDDRRRSRPFASVVLSGKGARVPAIRRPHVPGLTCRLGDGRLSTGDRGTRRPDGRGIFLRVGGSSADTCASR